MPGLTYQPQSITAITLSIFILLFIARDTFTTWPTVLPKHSVTAIPQPSFIFRVFHAESSSKRSIKTWQPSVRKWLLLKSIGSLFAACASSSIKLSAANPLVDAYTDLHHIVGTGDAIA